MIYIFKANIITAPTCNLMRNWKPGFSIQIIDTEKISHSCAQTLFLGVITLYLKPRTKQTSIFYYLVPS